MCFSLIFAYFLQVANSQSQTTPEHIIYTVDSGIQNFTEINLSLDLVYSVIFDDINAIDKVKIIIDESSTQYQEIDLQNKTAIMLIARKLFIQVKHNHKLTFSVISIERGVCQQESFLFTYNGGIRFTVEHSIQTREFCFIPYKRAAFPSNNVTKVSLAPDSKVFAVNYQETGTNLTEDFRNDLDHDFYVTYHDFDVNTSLKDVIEFEINGSTDGQAIVNCSISQIPFYDRSVSPRSDQQYTFTVNQCYDPIPEPPTDDNKMLLIIGCSIGGGILIIILIIVIVFCCKKKAAVPQRLGSEGVSPLIE